MTDPLPPTLAERIDVICDRFEAACKARSQPRVEDYLDGAAGPERQALLHELQRVDAHYRQRAEASAAAQMGTAVPPPQVPIVAGFEVLGELGRGGMGVVYKARQLRPNRLVALKMISAGVQAGPRELERFRREVDAVALLQHRHIVQLYEVGDQDGRPYFAMEYVAGGSLDRQLAGTPQPAPVAARVVELLAHAIHHAHQRGIIHRDLKPANVLLQITDHTDHSDKKTTEDSAFLSAPSMLSVVSYSPKITDFGLAKLLDSNAANPTQSGDLLGTPGYMAPEQITGSTGAIDAATDVYGLGTILYEMLTGRPPFRGATALETMLQVQAVEPVSPSRLRPNCPRDLVTICLKCLNKQPRQRYSSALELAEDLRRALDGKPIRARPVGPLPRLLKWARRQPVVASLAGLLLLAVAAGVSTGSWLWWQAEDRLKQTEAALGGERAAQTARVATLDRFQVALAHREWLANYVGRTDALLDACTDEQRMSWEWLYIDRMRRSALHTFSGHRNTVRAVAVHPDGRQLVSASHDMTVRLWDLETGSGKNLVNHKSLVLAVACSPDGRLLASSDSHFGSIKLHDAQTGALLRELTFEGTGEVSVAGLAFDPSSRYLAVGGPERLKVWDLRDQVWAYDRIAAGGDINQVAFSPDGRSIATASQGVRVWDWAADKLLHDWPGSGTGTHDLAFSPDGSLLASGGRDGVVRVHSLRTGREEFTLNAHQLSVTSVAFSPEGERLASAGQEGDMHVWNVKERRRLFTIHGHSGAVWDLAYAQNGSRLVSVGTDRLIRVWDAVQGQEVVTLPFQVEGEVHTLAYGFKGRYLAWGNFQGQAGLWDTVLSKEVRRLDAPDLVGWNPVTSFAFCPTGKQVAWRRHDGSVKLWDLANGKAIPLPAESQIKVLALAFSADGTQLLAAHWDKDALHLRDLRSAQVLGTLPRLEERITQAVWSPDARCLVTIEAKKSLRVWDTDTRELRCAWEHPGPVRRVTFSDDSWFLAVGGVAGALRVWDLAANRETMAVTGHSSNLYGLALSPDGRRLASTASDCTAKLWDTQTGHEVLTLRTHLHEHSPLAFSPDGADLASVGMDNRLQTWSTRSIRKVP